MKSIEIPVIWIILGIIGIIVLVSKIAIKPEVKEQEIAITTSKFDTVSGINVEEEIIEVSAEVVKEDDNPIEVEEIVETISIEDVEISKDMDLTVRTGLSKTDFTELMTNLKVDTSGFFEENAEIIYDLCEQYSINEIFFCGLIGEESGWNIASNHRRTHNYISLMSNGKLISYNSVYEGLETAAQKLHDNYLTSGGKFYHGATLAGLKVCFCPSSSTWIDAVYNRMRQVLN